jgi:carbonic anhydrase
MNRRHALKALTGLVLCPLCASNGFVAEGTHWTYEGTTGPDKWGDLDAASKVCSVGSQQSPIDIIGSIKAQRRRSGSPGARPPTPLSTTVTQSN